MKLSISKLLIALNCLVIIFWGSIINRMDYTTIIYMGILIIINAIYEDFLFITIRTLCFQIISLIATFAFVRNTNDLMKYVLIVAFSSSGANVVNFLVARKKYCKLLICIHNVF